MEVETFHNRPEAFRETALPFLMEAEPENNLLIGISLSLAGAGPPARPHDRFFWVVRSGAKIYGVAMWAPPHDLVLSHPFPDRALAALYEFFLDKHLSCPGVLGPNYVAREFAIKWMAATSLT